MFKALTHAEQISEVQAALLNSSQHTAQAFQVNVFCVISHVCLHLVAVAIHGRNCAELCLLEQSTGLRRQISAASKF